MFILFKYIFFMVIIPYLVIMCIGAYRDKFAAKYNKSIINGWAIFGTVWLIASILFVDMDWTWGIGIVLSMALLIACFIYFLKKYSPLDAFILIAVNALITIFFGAIIICLLFKVDSISHKKK